MTMNSRAQSVGLKSRKKGFTLTEIAIVLGIIGLLLGAVWKAASSVYQSSAATNVSQAMGQYLASVRSACSTTTCVGAAAGSFPAVTAPAPTISGVTTDTEDSNLVGGTGGGFTIKWSNIPTTSAGSNFCQALATAVAAVNGTYGTSPTTAVTAPTSAATCTAATGPVACAAVAGYTTSSTGITCTGGKPSTANCTVSATAATVCTGSPTTVGAYFNYSF